MHPKIKTRLTADKSTTSAVKPLLLHEVAKPTAPANPAARRRQIATQPASGTANHARHHVSRHTQS
jgi:hypothetical protein